MKTNYILIALAMIAALTMVSCKNNKKAQNQEPTQEEVQEMKQALADSVLTYIDALVEEFAAAADNGIYYSNIELTEAERIVKPDYLLDPSFANTLVTKTQKINAIAIYVVELGVRSLYDMPLNESKEAIAKLSAEVYNPFDIDKCETDTPLSQRIMIEYKKCIEHGNPASFWQFQYAILIESTYVIANNIDLFFDRITEEQWISTSNKRSIIRNVISRLAEYDEDMALLNSFINSTLVGSDEERDKVYASKEYAKQFYSHTKDKYIARRNALLQ